MSVVLIVFLPLFSSLICASLRKQLSCKWIGYIACGLMIISYFIAASLFTTTVEQNFIYHIKIASWFRIKDYTISWAIYADKLTIIMLWVISIISSIVHIYSIGYMADQKRFNTFMAYLGLFTFCMNMLVCADNMVQLFFGWEGVGLLSYLLIGFYYDKPSAINAAYKAFIVNRIADLAFLIGILLVLFYCDSLDFIDLAKHIKFLEVKNYSLASIDFSALDLACLLFFIGAMGKSAQIGFHIWLPDAMEGPTPVSALIHAATMVTAGVFLLARMNFFFACSNKVSNIVAIIGAITCVYGGLAAILQSNLKKIIAYSTCSQLGYMFIACGLKAYHAGIFHLMTHAFFKAALFLAAGNIIHATGEQNLQKIGNIRVNMRYTFLIFIVASSAIIGIPPLAGFYSKDLILEYAYSSNMAIFICALIGAFSTGFYSLKIITSIGFDTNAQNNNGAHEVSKVMLWPIFILIIGSIFAGLMGRYALSFDKPNGYLTKIMSIIPLKQECSYVPYLAFFASLLGCASGYFYTIKRRSEGGKNYFLDHYFFDPVAYIAPIFNGAAVLLALFDTYIIDGLIKYLVLWVRYLSSKVSAYHTGFIFDYASSILLVVGIAGLLFMVEII